MGLSKTAEAIEDIKAGKLIIIVDDANRENEGDLALAAEKVTPKAINFMARHARGLICMPVTGKRLDELSIPLMVRENTSKFSTAFTVSIEAKHRVSTGILAADRAEIKVDFPALGSPMMPTSANSFNSKRNSLCPPGNPGRAYSGARLRLLKKC